MELVEFGTDSALYEETMELRYRTFFKDFDLPKSVTPDDFESESIHLALLIDRELIAYGRLSPLSQGVYRISQVIVLESHRGKGFARILLNKLIDRAKFLGASNVELNAQVTAQRLYESCGFLPTEEPYKVKLTGVDHVKMAAAISTT